MPTEFVVQGVVVGSGSEKLNVPVGNPVGRAINNVALLSEMPPDGCVNVPPRSRPAILVAKTVQDKLRRIASVRRIFGRVIGAVLLAHSEVWGPSSKAF